MKMHWGDGVGGGGETEANEITHYIIWSLGKPKSS